MEGIPHTASQFPEQDTESTKVGVLMILPFGSFVISLMVQTNSA